MQAGGDTPASGAKRGSARVLTIALLVAAAVAVPLILLAGDGLEPQPELAGRYEVTQGATCLGPAFDARQSGRYLVLSRPNGDSIGRADLGDGRVTGTIECAGGESAELDAAVDGMELTGSVGTLPLDATRVRTRGLAAEQGQADPASLDAAYTLAPETECLGRSIELRGGDDPALSVQGIEDAPLQYADGLLSGTARCLDGDIIAVRGVPSGDRLELELEREERGPGEQLIEQAIAERDETFGAQVAAFFLAAAVILLLARLFGAVAARIGQPQVMGEILAGIVLGPTVFGALFPDAQAELFSADVLPMLGIAASLGLVIYLFMIGSDLDGGAMRGRTSQLAAIATAGFVVPFLMGAAAALALYEPLAPDVAFAPFALFMGIALAITALPVLAKILEERGMLGGPIGTAAMACAAIGDVVGWLLVTLAAALAVADGAGEVLPTIGWTVMFGVVLFAVVRPGLRKLAAAYDAAAGTPSETDHTRRSVIIALVYVAALLSAWATQEIGIALIVGAVALGAVMPRDTALARDARRNGEVLVSLILLPLFFASAGLRTDVGLLGDPDLWLMALGLFALAVAGKLGASALAARVAGFGWRDAGMLGTLMNTRGLTELIILTLGLELGVLSEALYTALVLMALVTTFMAGPLLRAFEPRPRSGVRAPG